MNCLLPRQCRDFLIQCAESGEYNNETLQVQDAIDAINRVYWSGVITRDVAKILKSEIMSCVVPNENWIKRDE